MKLLVGSHPAQVIAKVGEDAYRQNFGMLCSHRDDRLPDKAIACGVPWAMDNYAFVKFDPLRYEAFLIECRSYAASCLWVVAPDVPKDAVATLAQFWEWHCILRSYGYKVAYAAQNGIEHTSIPWQAIDCLFVGGDNIFKANCVPLVKEARERGKWTHMGRVNSRRRIRFCAPYFDSCDGSSYAAYPQKTLQHLSVLSSPFAQPLLMEVS